jgi:hypothetical protein
MSIHFHLSSSWDKIFRHETQLTVLHYLQQQHKTIWPYYTISSNTKPYDHITLSAAATQNHMTILHYQQQHKTLWAYYIISSSNTKPYDHYTISSNTKPYDHITLSAAATQNHTTILHYQQQHKTLWPYYIISSSNTKSHDHIKLSTANIKPYDHITLSAAATQYNMTIVYYQQQQPKPHVHVTL